MSPASAERMESISAGFVAFSTRIPNDAASGSLHHFERQPPRMEGSCSVSPSEVNLKRMLDTSGLCRSIDEAPEHASKRGFLEDKERIDTLAAPRIPQR